MNDTGVNIPFFNQLLVLVVSNYTDPNLSQ